MITLSHSSVSVYLDCQRCFWLRVHKRLRLPEIVRSNIPNVVDKMLKEVYDDYRNKGIPMEFELAEGRKLEVKLVDKKTYDRLSDISFPMELEGVKFKFQAMLDDCAIQDYGEGPILIPLDHKTTGSYNNFPTIHPSYIRQGTFYNFALDELGFNTRNTALFVYHYPKIRQTHTPFESPIEFEMSAKYINTFSTRTCIELMTDAIKCLKLENPPIGSDTCPTCRFVREASK